MPLSVPCAVGLLSLSLDKFGRIGLKTTRLNEPPNVTLSKLAQGRDNNYTVTLLLADAPVMNHFSMTDINSVIHIAQTRGDQMISIFRD
jgi:hypothetical protein